MSAAAMQIPLFARRAPLPRRQHFDVHAVSIPARTFTGDFYFTHHTGDRLWFAVGDVAGKGLPAALVMAMIQEELEHRILSCATAGCDPATTMQRLHAFLKPLLPVNRFATAVIGWLDDDGGVRLVNAGHCPPLIVRADGTIERVGSTGPAVGILPFAKWRSTTLTLDDGDSLVLYSDGVIEAAPVGGEELGLCRLEQALAPAEAAEYVAAAVIETVQAHTNGARYDDLTLVVIRR
jgi:sigma-B regulation protein RsbU (phosphoserine phosphatase)